MPQPYFEMGESRSVTPRVNRLYFEWPRTSSFLGLRLVKLRHKNQVHLLSRVKPRPRVMSVWFAEPITVKCPLRDNSLTNRDYKLQLSSWGADCVLKHAQNQIPVERLQADTDSARKAASLMLPVWPSEWLMKSALKADCCLLVCNRYNHICISSRDLIAREIKCQHACYDTLLPSSCIIHVNSK